jgi:hypothetical protein
VRPVDTTLVDCLVDAGYDVWLEDWRASILLERNTWNLDQAAVHDHLMIYMDPSWGFHAPGAIPRALALATWLAHRECDSMTCRMVSFTYGSGRPALWRRRGPPGAHRGIPRAARGPGQAPARDRRAVRVLRR